MKLSNQDVISALSDLSVLFAKEDFQYSKTEQKALESTMKALAKQLASQHKLPATVKEVQKVTPQQFKKNTLARLEKRDQMINRDIERLRRQNYQDKIAELRDRPEINAKSKKLVSSIEYSDTPPIYERVDEVIENREKKRKVEEERLGREKEEEESLNCTFIPNQVGEATRTNSEFVQEALEWRQNEIKFRLIEEKKKLKEESASMREKPLINEKSEKLATERSKIPILARLTSPKQVINDEKLPFKPKINIKSEEIIANKLKPTIQRLYTPKQPKTDQKIPSQSQTPLKTKKPIWLEESLPKQYMINTSSGAVYQQYPLNEIQLTPKIDFVVSSLIKQ